MVNRRWKRFIGQFRPSRWFRPATVEEQVRTGAGGCGQVLTGAGGFGRVRAGADWCRSPRFQVLTARAMKPTDEPMRRVGDRRACSIPVTFTAPARNGGVRQIGSSRDRASSRRSRGTAEASNRSRSRRSSTFSRVAHDLGATESRVTDRRSQRRGRECEEVPTAGAAAAHHFQEGGAGTRTR
jgi:hypothetical protein